MEAVEAVLLLADLVLLILKTGAAIVYLNRNAVLSSMRRAAERSAYGRDSIYQLLDWCYDNPTRKTTTNVLRHLQRIIHDRPPYVAVAATISWDVSSQEFDRATKRLVEELHDDAHSDIAEADRTEILALLL